MTKTLAFRTVDDKGTVIVVLGATAPTDGDWKLLVEAHRKEHHQRALVVTAGGGPTPAQRKAILDVTGGKGLPAAIMTNSVVVRGIATALSWFAPGVRAYAPNDLKGALAHLHVSVPINIVQRVIDELKLELQHANSEARNG